MPKPGTGEETTVQSSPAGRLEFAFDPSASTTSRPEGSNDLVFEVDGGGRLIISGFFEVGTYPLPDMVMPDGLVVASADFIAVNNPDMDVATAAGPRPSGGGASYDDDAGNLLDGVDKLGDLEGADAWDNSRGGWGFGAMAAELGTYVASTWDLSAFSGAFGGVPESALRESNAQGLDSISQSATLTAGSQGVVDIGFGDLSGIGVSNIEGDIIWEYGRNLDGSVNATVIVGYRDLDLDGEADDIDGENGISEDDAIIRISLIAPDGVAPGETATIEVTIDLLNPAFNTEGDENMVVSGITLVATEQNGNEISSSFGVTVVDDRPWFVPDENGVDLSADAGVINAGVEFHGAWEINYGADGDSDEYRDKPVSDRVIIRDENGGKIGEVEVDTEGGSYPAYVDGNPDPIGWFTFERVHEDGADKFNFTFKAAPSEAGDGAVTYSFSVEGFDADGDSTGESAGVPITIIPRTPPEGTVLGGGNDEAFSDRYLEDGTLAGFGPTEKEIGLPAGWKVDPASGGWTDADGDGVYTLEGAYGHLSYNTADNTLTYTQDRPGGHSAPDIEEVKDDFGNLVLIDGFGNSADVPAEIRIGDDEPYVGFSGQDGTVYTGMEYSGHWNAVFGADGPAAVEGLTLEVAVDGQTLNLPMIKDQSGNWVLDPAAQGYDDFSDYGALVFNSDGTFTFTPAADAAGKGFGFTLVATDADGDVVRSGDSIDITVEKPAGPGIEAITAKDGKAFDEAGLADGTAPDQAALTRELALPDGYRVNTDGWTDNGDGTFSLDADQGTLTYAPAGNSLKYELDEARTAGSADDGRDVYSPPDVTITLEDA
ncbi:MAG: hypothetical protein LBB52_00650, partial [Desulfovibrio sp.]|nr:hypothetical protein [Desulfovibrio sp.]